MNRLRLRPTFSHVMEQDPEEVRRRIVGKVEADGARCEVKSFPGFICLRVPEEERRFWSPRLNISLEREADGTRIQGTYGPNANMWSSLLYGYLLIGSIGLFSGIFGFCQHSLGMRPWGLWIFGASVAIGAGMSALAWIGRGLGERQTRELHRIYQTAAGLELDLC